MKYRVIVVSLLGVYFFVHSATDEPVFFIKNNSDRGVFIQLIIDKNKNSLAAFDEKLILPTEEFIVKRKEIASIKDINGLLIRYPASNVSWHPQTPKLLYSKTYTATFITSPAVEKYFLKFVIDDHDQPSLVPQKGTLGRTSDLKYNLNKNVRVQDIRISMYDPNKPDGQLNTNQKSDSRLEAKYQKGSTQTEAHLSVPVIQKEVERIYDFSKNNYYKELYNQVVVREREHSDCYCFYSAFTNEWRVPQDLYLAIYESITPVSTVIKDFRAFRWIPVDHQTPEQYLKNEFLNNGMVNDNDFQVKAYLLSTNLALFGNVGFPGECTFEYFINAKSHAFVDDAVFKGVLDIFDDPTQYKSGEEPVLYKYIPRIKRLTNLLSSTPLSNFKKPQSLSQICIPKSLVDEVGYISWVQGIPYEDKLVNWISVESQSQLGKQPVFTYAAPVLKNVRKLFKDEKQKHPLFKEVLEGIEQGKYRLSTILEEYINNPRLVPGLNNLQARLIITPKYMGNVASGIKVYLYDRISTENKKKYEQELSAIVAEIQKDFLAIPRQKRTANKSALVQ